MSKKLAITMAATLMIDLDQAGPVIAAIGAGSLYKREGWGDSAKWVGADDTPTFEILEDDAFKEKPEPLIKLQDQLRVADSRWLDYYRQCADKDAEIKTLREKLQSIQSTVANEPEAS